MRNAKKIIAALLASTMVLGMSVTTFAADYEVGSNQGEYQTKPDAADRATVKITGITGSPTVTLYQIASVQYGSENVEFVKYNWVKENMFADPAKPTSDEINGIAQGLIATQPTIDPMKKWETKNVGSTYIQEVPAGVYIAVLTEATNGDIYNPILLTATYNDKGLLVTEGISSNDCYLWGSTAVAKSSSPTVDKEITGGTTDDEGHDTASVGDVVDYTVTPTVPTYPQNATNKTFFISDRLSEGLTFDYNSLTVTIKGQTVIRDDDTFKLDGKVIATASNIDSGKTVNGFNLNFDYEQLVYDGVGHVYQPIVTYSAVVNDKAVVGDQGNGNKVTYYYGDPNNGSTWEETDNEPDEAKNVYKKTDSETVYTYQLAFLKTGEGVDTEGKPTTPPLEGAKFGIYKDQDCTQLIDIVTTNQNGYAVSANVEAGIYYVKELVAPIGYSLNEKIYPIEATWKTAITTSTATETERTYTTDKPSDDALQVGWLKNDVFYSFEELGNNTEGYSAAYLKSEKTTDSNSSTFLKNQNIGGTALMDDPIPNTKLSTLPSTGGIGTTIFTIGGCAIMIAAAGLFFASRRKQENK